MTSEYLQGACLYIPALHSSLNAVVHGRSIPDLRLVVVCLEDTIADGDTEQAMSHLRLLFKTRRTHQLPRTYVRPRSLAMLNEILQWDEQSNWDGFVLPKLTIGNIEEWLCASSSAQHAIMPILETAEVFDPCRVSDFCDVLESARWSSRIEAVRIGGTDLFATLGTRRPRSMHIYDSIIGSTLRMVSCSLMSRGWSVTAPVCESLVANQVMDAEIRMDVDAGFVGKTAISPLQVRFINDSFRVSMADLLEAKLILGSEQTVFRSRDAMCEVAPHLKWATRIVDRASVFGISPRDPAGTNGNGSSTKSAQRTPSPLLDAET